MEYKLDLTELKEWPGKHYVAVAGYGAGYRIKPMWELNPHEYFMDRADWWAQRLEKVYSAEIFDVPPTNCHTCNCPGCQGSNIADAFTRGMKRYGGAMRDLARFEGVDK